MLVTFALAASAAMASSAQAANAFAHGWDTTAAMTFADFRSPTLMTDAQVEFAASKYRIVSLEKCTAVSSGWKTEAAIYDTAMRLKAANPSIKVIFYFPTDGAQGLSCYAADEELQAHPEWWFRDDNGNVVGKPNAPILDTTNAEARDWWINVPLGGINGTGMYNNTLVSTLIDGVLADNAGWSYIANVSTARLEGLSDGKVKMMAALQDKFTAANGGIVMANGISMYDGVNEDPRYPGDHNVKVLQSANAIMNEHTAAFESVSSANASLNVYTVEQDLEALTRAATMSGGSKTVFLQTWPGLYAGVQKYPPVANGGEPTPTNNSEWREALRSHFMFNHALFLTVAENNTYWFYGATWYDSETGYLACPEDLNSCPAPPEWYPNLEKPLGAPLGPRVLESPYIWNREFEHATVHLDLNHWNLSSVTFK